MGRKVQLDLSRNGRLQHHTAGTFPSVGSLGWILFVVVTLPALGVLARGRRSGARASARARDIERGFRDLFAASGIPALIVGEEGDVIDANPAAHRLLAADGTSLAGTSVDSLVPLRSRRDHLGLRESFWAQPTARAMSVGRVVSALGTDGRDLPVEVTLSPVRIGAQRAVLVTLVDLTARTRAEQELRTRTEELQRSNAALERFAWSASHDLQEPLRMISSYSQLLARRYADALDDDGRQMVSFTIDGTVRMQRLINELLTYARASQGDKPHVVTDTRAQWDAAIELLANEIRSIGADVALDSELPDVVADPVEVRQVFQNLVGNALKYRSDGPTVVRAGCSGVHEGLARFHVTDNGIGIDPRHHDKIFEAFQRLGTRASGTGIGLALCKTVVASHGGEIGVDSTLDGGATFWFTLPIARTETP